jgi:hypothetical protein
VVAVWLIALLLIIREDPGAGATPGREVATWPAGRGQMAREGARCMSTWRLPLRRGRERRYLPRGPHVAFQSPLRQSPRRAHVNAPPRFSRPASSVRPVHGAAPSAARWRRGGGAVDSPQRGGGPVAVSSSVAHVYIGSSPVDSAHALSSHAESDCGQP